MLRLIALMLVAMPILASASQFNSSNYTVAEANATISQAESYINAVNQSGYLIFSPNLTQANSYLNTSLAVYKESPASAVLYAQLADRSAEQAYLQISRYKSESFVATLIFTAVVAFILYGYGKPIKGRRGKTAKNKAY